jgi:hypothetical protein
LKIDKIEQVVYRERYSRSAIRELARRSRLQI